MLFSLAVIGINIYQILGDAIIGNEYVVLGVNEYADLNVPYVGGIFGCPAGDPLGINQVGLRTYGCQYASTEPGCQCEGWGVGVIGSGISIETGANQDSGGLLNILPVSFSGSNGGNTATVVTKDTTGTVQVTHQFDVSSNSMYAMKVTVTIKNIDDSGRNFDRVLYRRAMDWDIYPTPFSEYVTIGGTGPARASGVLIHSSDNGFCDSRIISNPDCGFRDPACDDQDCTDAGPSDHGAQFDFSFGALAHGKSVKFEIFYGVAPGEHRAITALGNVAAEVYSLGQQRDDPTGGLPYTFFFGFAGVGGEPVDPGCDTTVPYNVMFIMDESGSVRSTGYDLSKAFIEDLINDVSINSKVAIFEFNSITTTIHLFNEQQIPRDGPGSMIQALEDATFSGGGTDTEEAIRDGLAEWTRADAAGDLAPGTRIQFLITDGIGSSPCAHRAALDALGVRTYVVAVGGFSDTFVSCLMQDPVEDVFRVNAFTDEDFAEVEDELLSVICPDDLVVPDEPKNCREAQRYCKEVVGTQLATIRTDADRTEAIGVLDEAGEDFAWVGLYSDDVETYWQWRSGDECLADSAYKCVDEWCAAPGGEDFRPRCIGPSEGGSQCAVFYKNGNEGTTTPCFDNDVPIDVEIAFICDAPDA